MSIIAIQLIQNHKTTEQPTRLTCITAIEKQDQTMNQGNIRAFTPHLFQVKTENFFFFFLQIYAIYLHENSLRKLFSFFFFYILDSLLNPNSNDI